MEPVRFQVGQSFGTYDELKAKLEAMSTSKKDFILSPEKRKIKEDIAYFNILGEQVGSVFNSSRYIFKEGKPVYPSEDIKNQSTITIGNVAYQVPTIRDGKGGQVRKIIVDYKTIAIDKNNNGIIDEGELITDNTKNNK